MQLRALLLVILLFVGRTLANAANPNHLEPISAWDPEGYQQAVFDALIGKRRPVLWMVCHSAFSPEYAVILRTEPLNPTVQNPSFWNETRKATVEVATASHIIWGLKDYPPNYRGRLETELRQKVKIHRRMIEIDRAFAEEIGKSWEGVIRRTRYTNRHWRGYDGNVYQFYRDYGYFGETWSPNTGLPAALVDLAEHLKKVVESGTAEQKILLAEGLRKAKKLQVETAKSERDRQSITSRFLEWLNSRRANQTLQTDR